LHRGTPPSGCAPLIAVVKTAHLRNGNHRSASGARIAVPADPWPAKGASWMCDTTHQYKTHNAEPREVQYPWHPWFGRTVWVYRIVVRGTRSGAHCGLDRVQCARSLEVLLWMLEAASCSTVPIETPNCMRTWSLRNPALWHCVHRAPGRAAGFTESVLSPFLTAPPCFNMALQLQLEHSTFRSTGVLSAGGGLSRENEIRIILDPAGI
jgi:hypothetical protein